MFNWLKAPDFDLSLADLEVSSSDDPGTHWHPSHKPITDLTDAEVKEHLLKPEALSQPDAGQSLDHGEG